MPASSSGTPITEVLAMLNPGMVPVRFIARIMKKKVVRIGRKRRPSFLPSRSSAMPTRTKSSPISMSDCPRPGTIFRLRVASQKTSTITIVVMMRMSMTRLISK